MVTDEASKSGGWAAGRLLVYQEIWMLLSIAPDEQSALSWCCCDGNPAEVGSAGMGGKLTTRSQVQFILQMAVGRVSPATRLCRQLDDWPSCRTARLP
jgi:hypothetical protein